MRAADGMLRVVVRAAVMSRPGTREGGGGTHPGFGCPLENVTQKLLLSMRSMLEKRGLSLTQVL